MAIQFPTSSLGTFPVQEVDQENIFDDFDDDFNEKPIEAKMSPVESAEKLTGKVLRIVFSSEKSENSNGFAILAIETSSGRKETVSGTLAGYKVGDTVSLRVEVTTHPKYGKQYKAIGILSNEEQDPVDQLSAFLEAGFISHIGPARTRAIIEKFGKDFTEIMKKDPEALTVISGITPARSVEIFESWQKYRGKWEIMGAMRQFGIPDNLLLKWSQLPDISLRFEAIKNNPYLLTKERGIGFLKADIIAKKNGISEMADIRIEAGLAYALEQSAQEGHTCLPLSSLFEQTKVLLFQNNRGSSDSIFKKFETVFVKQKDEDMPLFFMKIRENAQGEKKVFAYSYNSYKDENTIVDKITKKLLLHTKKNKYFTDLLDKWERSEEGFILHEQQRAALLMASTSPISIITGGPGTGKTTILSLLVDLCDRETIACCAPTGRAAKRMGEVITSEWGTKPQTIHRLLGYTGSEFKAEGESSLGYDFIIVDEVSMLDQSLFASLLRSIDPRTRLVLIGDADQLPSVGAGNVLKDIIESGEVPVTCLTKIYRQSEDSYIPRNAWAVSHGKQEYFTFEKGRDFSYHSLNLSQNLGQQVLAQVSALQEFGLEQKDIMVLSPKKAGTLGVASLNALLQKYFNPNGKMVPFPVFEDRLPLRLGDPVMQTKNDYSRGVFNGDIGYIAEIKDKKIKIAFDYDLEIAKKELHEIEWWTSIDAAPLIPAYASTVHKAQGGQAEGVLMVCDKSSHHMACREILYTGITRAKKFCSLIGDKSTVIYAIETSNKNTRCTGLKDELSLAVKTLLAEVKNCKEKSCMSL